MFADVNQNLRDLFEVIRLVEKQVCSGGLTEDSVGRLCKIRKHNNLDQRIHPCYDVQEINSAFRLVF